MWITDPNEAGRGTGLVFLADLCIVANSLTSSTASDGNVSRVRVSLYREGRNYFIVSIWRNPTLARMKSSVHVILDGRDVDTLSTHLRIGTFTDEDKSEGMGDSLASMSEDVCMVDTSFVKDDSSWPETDGEAIGNEEEELSDSSYNFDKLGAV
jgi:hypothetical protein